MDFVSEYISEEDVKKYSINDLYDRFHPFFKIKNLPNYRHFWVIDKKRNIYLMFISSGTEETANRYTFLLNWSGVEIVVILEKKGSADFKADKGHVTWKLLHIRKPSSCEYSDVAIARCMKEALTVYGYRGAKKIIGNYKVDFQF